MIYAGPASFTLTRSSASVTSLQPADARRLDRAVGATPGDALAGADRAVGFGAAPATQACRVGVEVGDVRALERSSLLVGRRRDPLDHEVEQGAQVRAGFIGTQTKPSPRESVGVHHREVDLSRRRRPRSRNSSEHLVVDLVGRAWAVHLVDHPGRRSRAASAWRRTNQVCGRGPSEASTSRSSRPPSSRARSTSPRSPRGRGCRRC